MKTLLSLIFVFSTASVFGDLQWFPDDYPNVRPSWSGSWYNPDQSGHGISVQILDEEHTVIYWYTYDLDGNPLWLVGKGSNSQVSLTPMSTLGPGLQGIRVEATAYYYEGMIYGEFDPATNNRQKWGTIILEFAYDLCDGLRMEWDPVVAGFSQGSVGLRRLTTLYDLDCVHGPYSEGSKQHETAGNWEVQFGRDAEHKYQVEIVATPNPEIPDLPFLTFEFLDETGCLWSGQVHQAAYQPMADWGNQCGATAVEHMGRRGLHYFEYKLCDSENECVWKDEVMVFEGEGAHLFEDDGEHLIFSR